MVKDINVNLHKRVTAAILQSKFNSHNMRESDKLDGEAERRVAGVKAQVEGCGAGGKAQVEDAGGGGRGAGGKAQIEGARRPARRRWWSVLGGGEAHVEVAAVGA